MELMIRKMQKSDWENVKRIYHEGILTKKATFQTQLPTWEEWDNGHVQECRFIAETKECEICGWAALSPVSGRCVYSGVAEVSIYIDERYRGKGIGKVLLSELIIESEKSGFWTLQSGVFEDNFGSLNLHKKCGFREVGRREKIGKTKEGVWKDTILLEKRSNTVGVD